MQVHIIDDEPEIRHSLSFMLKSGGIESKGYDSAEDFVDQLPHVTPGCLLVDMRMPGMSGLALQLRLHEMGCNLPVVLMTGHGDVSSAVRAMKEGAIDFLEKPFTKADLMAAIDAARDYLEHPPVPPQARQSALARIGLLTKRELEVVDGLVKGHLNKRIAFDLGISPRTVEVHRANAMKKTEVHVLSELLHIAFLSGLMDQQDTAA